MTTAAMHIARTGIDAQDMRMRVISNNLANVNTTAFKRDRASFETLSYQVVTAAGAPSSSETKYATGLNLGTGGIRSSLDLVEPRLGIDAVLVKKAHPLQLCLRRPGLCPCGSGLRAIGTRLIAQLAVGYAPDRLAFANAVACAH